MSDEGGAMHHDEEGGVPMHPEDDGRHAAFDLHVEEASALPPNKLRTIRVNRDQLFLKLKASADLVRTYWASEARRPGFETVPFLMPEGVADRIESLAQAAQEAHRLHHGVRRQGVDLEASKAAYRRLRRCCTLAAKWVPDVGGYEEGLSAVLDDHPWVQLRNLGAMSTAHYELSVFAMRHRGLLVVVPGAMDAIRESRSWVGRSTPKSAEAWLDLRERFISLALIEHERVRDAARFLWGEDYPGLLRRFRLPSARSAPEATVEEEVTPSADPLPETGSAPEG